MGWMSDESGLEKKEANYVPLTPLSHLRRASTVFSDRTLADFVLTWGWFLKDSWRHFRLILIQFSKAFGLL